MITLNQAKGITKYINNPRLNPKEAEIDFQLLTQGKVEFNNPVDIYLAKLLQLYVKNGFILLESGNKTILKTLR